MSKQFVSRFRDAAFETEPGGLVTFNSPGHAARMDPEGTKKVVQTLLTMRPGLFRHVVLAHDGDAKCPSPATIDPRCECWVGGRCYCHMCKNTEQNARDGMSKQQCPGHPTCPNLDRPGERPKKSCSNAKGNRWSPELNRKLKRRVLQLLKGGACQYHNEPDPALRERKRNDAKVWFRRQLVALVLHFSGDHGLCDHGDLPADYPSVKCKGQIGYLAHLLLVYEKKLDELLTPLGLVHVNMGESFFHTNALFRPKIHPWQCAGNLLASSQSALYTQELNLAYWSLDEEPNWYWQDEVLKELNAFLGSGIRFTATETARRRTHLIGRVKGKAAWNDSSCRARREKARARKRQKADVKTPEYNNLRTEAGMEAAIAEPGFVPALGEDEETDEAVTALDELSDDTARGVDNRIGLWEDDLPRP